MKMVRCGFAHEALTAIDEAEEGAYLDLDYRVVASLKEKGLVSAYPTWFYQEMLSSAAELKNLRKRLKETQDEITSYKIGIMSLEFGLDEWGYTKKERQSRREKLADKRRKHAERSRTAEKLGAKVERLEAMPEPGDYKPTLDGDYVRLTMKGELVKAHLSGRHAELEDILLEDVERKLEAFQARLDAHYSRFIEIWALMLKGGFRKGHTDVFDCAVRLSTIEGPVPEIYRRMGVINDYFYYHYNSPFSTPFKGYNRLIPAFAITMQDGGIETLKEGLIGTYRKLVRKGYYKNFFTWWLAAEAMNDRLDGWGYLGGVGWIIKRYDAVRDALAKEGWKKRVRHTDYIAASLARRHDSPELLAKNLRVQQRRLASTGRTDGMDLGTAALILLDSEASLEERTDRFVRTFEEMAARGWEKHSYFYPAAAALSLLPGSEAENVLWLDRIVARLKADGYADENNKQEGHKDGLTYRALPLLMAAYKGQFSQEVMPSIITHIKDPLFQS